MSNRSMLSFHDAFIIYYIHMVTFLVNLVSNASPHPPPHTQNPSNILEDSFTFVP